MDGSKELAARLEITRQQLADMLSTVTRVIPARSSLDILTNVLLTAGHNSLTVSGSDLEKAVVMQATTGVSCNATDPVCIAMPARQLREAVSKIGGDMLVMDIDADPHKMKLCLRSGKSTMSLHGVSGDGFPLLNASNGSRFVVDAEVLRRGLECVTFAAEPGIARPVLQAVCLAMNEDRITAVACDGYRLSQYSLEYDGGMNERALVPAPTMAELQRLLGTVAGDTEVVCRISPTQFFAELPGLTLISQLIAGTYIEYQEIIPKAFNPVAVVDKTLLLQAVRLADIVASEQAGCIEIAYLPDNTLTITATAAGVGNTETSVPARYAAGHSPTEPVVVSYGATKLAQVLSVMGEEVELAVSGKTSPTMLRPEGLEHDNFLHIIMPMIDR